MTTLWLGRDRQGIRVSRRHTALRAYAAAGKGKAYFLDRQGPDGRWIGGHFKSVVIHDDEKKQDLCVTALVIPLLSPTGGR